MSELPKRLAQIVERQNAQQAEIDRLNNELIVLKVKADLNSQFHDQVVELMETIQRLINVPFTPGEPPKLEEIHPKDSPR